MKSAIQDAEFPGLAAALNVDGMLDSLRAALPECRGEAGLALLGGSVVDVRYRPGGPCWVLYNITLRRDDRRSVRQLLSGLLLRADETPAPLPEALVNRYSSNAGALLATPMVWLPELPMVVYPFPVDEALPGLLDARDAAIMRAQLNQLWRRRKVRVRRVRPHLLGYTPQARAAFSYEVFSEERQTGLPEVRRLVGKLHAKKEAARLFADAWAVWRAVGDRVDLAPPVGYLATAGLTLQEVVPGTRLGGLVTEPSFPKWVRRSARMLAQLHHSSAPLSSRRKAIDEAQSVHRWAGVLLTIRSDLAARVERLRDRLAAEVMARTQLLGPIHGDFHHTNILVDGDLVTFIDLDECAIGDPMVDVGRFLASLRIPARRAFGDSSALREAGETFLETYLRHHRGDERRARLFEAASLLIAGASAFRIQRPTWIEEVEELLAEAERVFEAACTATVMGNGAKGGKGGEGGNVEQRLESRARWAEDGIFLQAALAPSVRRAYGAEPIEWRIEPAERENASRFRYQVSLDRDAGVTRVSLEGVLRRGGGARGVMERVEAVRRSLGASPDGLLLPRPVAFLGSLGLIVWEPPAGRRLSTLAGSAEATPVAERLAVGLALLHNTPVGFRCPPRTLDDTLRQVSKRIAALASSHRDEAAEAMRVLHAVERCSHRLPVRFAAALRTVHPKHVVWDGVRTALQRVDDILPAHPLLDAADFAAHCAALGLTGGEAAAWATIASDFRAAYLLASGEDPDDLAVCEATALLRLASRRASKQSDPALCRQLIEMAESRLDARLAAR